MSSPLSVVFGVGLSAFLLAGCAARGTVSASGIPNGGGADRPAADTLTRGAAPLTPRADHHKHLISPAAAAHATDDPLPEVSLPSEFAQLLRVRAEGWNDAERMAQLYTDSAIVLDIDGPVWIRGRETVASYFADLFAQPHRVKPIAVSVSGNSAFIAGYYVRSTEQGLRHFGNVLMTLRRDRRGAWRIASELPSFPGTYTQSPLEAEQLIAELDAAGIEKAVAISQGYWFASGLRRYEPADEYARVRAENDWTAAQAARFPDRLVAFCSFNPLRDYALPELDRCATSGRFRGIKLHFGNSRVDIRNAEHLAQLRNIFRRANEHRLPILAHLWTSPAFEQEGGEHARIFIDALLPEAPDVVVQIAHLTGGGRSTAPALAVFADAIANGDPRTRNVHFDVATLVEGQSDAGLERDAERMRQIGLERILWGSDTAPPNPAARQSWLTFRARLPLTDDEFRQIASNVAPYLR